MMKLADISYSRNGRPKVDFFHLGIFNFLKTTLGFRYTKFNNRGHYLKEVNGVYSKVKFYTLSIDFKNYISENFEELEISKEISKDDFLDEFKRKSPIKNGSMARDILSENFELSEKNKQLLLEQMKNF
jgi:hypothetical protein